MSGPLDIIRQVVAAGGRLRAAGDGSLQVSAPAPLPEVLVESLRAHKAVVLAALGPVAAPTEWVTGVARLGAMPPPAMVRRQRWWLTVADARRFLRDWGGKASALGWTTAG
jgi:hypothetical protein